MKKKFSNYFKRKYFIIDLLATYMQDCYVFVFNY